MKEYSHFFRAYAEHSYFVVQAPAKSHRIACKCWSSLVFGSRLLQESQPHICSPLSRSPIPFSISSFDSQRQTFTPTPYPEKKTEVEALNHFKIFYCGFETYGLYISKNTYTLFFLKGETRKKIWTFTVMSNRNVSDTYLKNYKHSISLLWRDN